MKYLKFWAVACAFVAAFTVHAATTTNSTSEAVNSGLTQNTGGNESSAWSLLFPSDNPGGISQGKDCLTSGITSTGGGWNFGRHSYPSQVWSTECSFPADVDMYMKTCQFQTAKFMMDDNAAKRFGIKASDAFPSEDEYKKHVRTAYPNMKFEDCVKLRTPPPAPVAAAAPAAPQIIGILVPQAQTPLVFDAPSAGPKAAPTPAAPASAPVPKTVRELTTERSISLNTMTLFASGKHDLMPGGEKALRKALKPFSPNNVTQIVVEGRTDDVGTVEYNKGLSQRRAETVAAVLRNLGYQNVTAEGYGKLSPIVEDTSAMARAINRSVLIKLQEITRATIALDE